MLKTNLTFSELEYVDHTDHGTDIIRISNDRKEKALLNPNFSVNGTAFEKWYASTYA